MCLLRCYQAEERPGLAAAQREMSLFPRIWLSIFGEKTRYPHHCGYFQSGRGGSVEFNWTWQLGPNGIMSFLGGLA